MKIFMALFIGLALTNDKIKLSKYILEIMQCIKEQNQAENETKNQDQEKSLESHKYYLGYWW